MGYAPAGITNTLDIEEAYRIRDLHIAEWMISRAVREEWRGASTVNVLTGEKTTPVQVRIFPPVHERFKKGSDLRVRPASSPREPRTKEPRVWLIFVSGDSYKVSHRADLPMYENLSTTIKVALETKPSMAEDLKYLIVINGESHSRFSPEELKEIMSR